jgi:single-strand DNA-binding protein
MNVVILTGNLARDPEKTYTSNGMAVARFTVAINRVFGKKTEGGQDADFIRITCFDKQAELVEKFLTKESKVGIEGRIQTGSYQGKDGNTVYTTDVIANRVEFLDSKRSADGSSGNFGGQFADRQDAGPPERQGQAEAIEAPPDAFTEMDDDDMPF